MSRRIDRTDSTASCRVVAAWFRTTFGAPTPPQRLGWPAIAARPEHADLRPDRLGQDAGGVPGLPRPPLAQPRARREGSAILYVSPLKALNQDIYRNLAASPRRASWRRPSAEASPCRRSSVAVRSGDTPPAERQRLVRKPPDILITTPESLHLMLTSRARETLRSVSHVIVDEIHALCPNKRGVFLALLLERLEALNPEGFVRVGLSATQRPLDEVARYLGGLAAGRSARRPARFEPRPVTIVDTGRRKELDLEVIVPFDRPGRWPPGSVWPAIERRLLDLIRAHRSTIVFANNRRVVERLTAHLNELAERPTTASAGARPLARSHHGSLSLDERRATEEALKRGRAAGGRGDGLAGAGHRHGGGRPGLPGRVARQRRARAPARRAGGAPASGGSSKGRLIAKTPGDLLESAALCRAMLRGEVETLRVPTDCLDVLAQQVVACVAMDRWDVARAVRPGPAALPLSRPDGRRPSRAS